MDYDYDNDEEREKECEKLLRVFVWFFSIYDILMIRLIDILISVKKWIKISQ